MIRAAHLEPGVALDDALVEGLVAALRDFARFHEVAEVVEERSDPERLAPALHIGKGAHSLRPAAQDSPMFALSLFVLCLAAPRAAPVHVGATAAHASIDAIQDALVRQLYLPVRWTECVQNLAQRGVTRIGECGPGKVLAGLVKRIDKSLDARPLGVADVEAALNDWRV